MAAGPLAPTSQIPDTSGKAFPYIYPGTNQGGTPNASPNEEGMGIAASIAADTKWMLRFQMPPVIPAGTMKLVLRQLANATSGVMKCTVSDANVSGSGGIPSGVTLTGETQTSVTWAASDNDKYKESKVTLTGSAGAAGGDEVVCALTFNTSGYTLAQILWTQAFIIWE